MNGLDNFVFTFIKILAKHVDYVIISGYVSILFGRSRATEDIDVFIKELTKEKLVELYGDLKQNGYWCLNTDDVNEIYNYLSDGLAVRFAIRDKTIPNFEVKFAKKKLDKEALNDRITVITEFGKLLVSSLEIQIAFKKFYLKSDKDIEDAKHIEKIFKDKINNKKVEKYKRLIENELSKA